MDAEVVQQSDVDLWLSFVYNIRTERTYRSALLPLIGKPFTTEGIQAYVDEWVGASQATINLRSSALRSFVRRMAKRGKCDEKILANIDYPKGPKVRQRRGVTSEELEQLFGATETTMEQMLLVILVETGLRLGSICEITHKDLNGESFIVIAKGERPVEIFTTETMTALSEKLMAEVGAEEEDYVFGHNRAGGPVLYRTLYRILNRIASRAGVKVEAHMFRHRFITRMAEEHDITVAKELAGHMNVATTMGYVHPARRRLHEAVQQGREAHHYVRL